MLESMLPEPLPTMHRSCHTEQIKAAKEARDASIEKMHPGTPCIGAAAEQVHKDAGLPTSIPLESTCWDIVLLTLVGQIIQDSRVR